MMDEPYDPLEPAPVSREALEQHFAGYEVETPITVALRPVALADRAAERDAS